MQSSRVIFPTQLCKKNSNIALIIPSLLVSSRKG